MIRYFHPEMESEVVTFEKGLILQALRLNRYGLGSFGSSQLSRGGSTQSTATSMAEIAESLFQARIGTLEEELVQEKEARAHLQQQAEEERQARQRLEDQFAEFRQMFASGQLVPRPSPPP